jgi:uncharacterized protein YjbJ (UPF0337 family)
MKKKTAKGIPAGSWDRLEGEWKQQRGKAVYRWGMLMNDELAAIAGKHEELVGRMQERYGIASDKAKRQADEYRNIVDQLKASTAKLVTLERHMHAGKVKTPNIPKVRQPQKRKRSLKTRRGG